MKLNKLLVATSLIVPASTAPLALATSCASAWGHKAPLSIGSIEKGDLNDPYANFRDEGSSQYYDIDGLYIPSYLQSNYAIDVSGSTNYAYTTPVKTWTYEDNKKTYKQKDANKWVNDTSLWANSNTSMSTSITDGNSVTQTCPKNITLTANISFVDTIGQFLSKYITYAINYAVSQLHNDNDFNIAWGGKAPTTTSENKRQFWELMYANSNSHASGKTEAYLKTTNSNFNFRANSFPIPSYNKDKDPNGYPVISAATKKLLTGDENGDLAAGNNQYWSDKSESGSGDDKYTTYTYPAVPVLIDFTNISQRFINPKNSGSFFISDFYQNDKTVITNEIGNAWYKMSEKDESFLEPVDPAKPDGDKKVYPHYYKYDLVSNGKNVAKDNVQDLRLKNLDAKGNSFVAFVTYSYVHWNTPNLDKNRYDTVTLSSLQTIMPAYLLDYKTDIYKHVNGDSSAYIVDVNKADKYSTQLINLLSRNSNEGRTAHAADLSDEYKVYLNFLAYLFAGVGTEFGSNFINATPWPL